MNCQGEAIGQVSLFKHQPFDYVDEDHDLPQGHENYIRMFNLLPKNKKLHEKIENEPVMLWDWPKCTGANFTLLLTIPMSKLLKVVSLWRSQNPFQ